MLGARASLHLAGLPGADLRALVRGTARNGLRLDHLALGGGRSFLVVMGLRMVLSAGCRGRLLCCRGCSAIIDDVDLIADDDAGVCVGVVLWLLAARGNASAKLRIVTGFKRLVLHQLVPLAALFARLRGNRRGADVLLVLNRE